MDLILVAVISLGAIGLIAAVILYAASKKFAVYEDPRIAKVSEVLPQANCGGCGYPGCSGFAGACVKAADAGSLEGKLCPVGGAPVMEKVAAILGLEAVAAEPKVAVVRCNGSCENRPRTALYDGAKSCAIAHATSGGETGCTFGCLKPVFRKWTKKNVQLVGLAAKLVRVRSLKFVRKERTTAA